jgi:hypothetical protein
MKEHLIYGRMNDFNDKFNQITKDNKNKSEGMKLCSEFMREMGK